MRPAHRCRAEGGLRVVVHAYGRRNPWEQPGAAQISYIKDLLAIWLPGHVPQPRPAGGARTHGRCHAAHRNTSTTWRIGARNPRAHDPGLIRFS